MAAGRRRLTTWTPSAARRRFLSEPCGLPGADRGRSCCMVGSIFVDGRRALGSLQLGLRMQGHVPAPRRLIGAAGEPRPSRAPGSCALFARLAAEMLQGALQDHCGGLCHDLLPAPRPRAAKGNRHSRGCLAIRRRAPLILRDSRETWRWWHGRLVKGRPPGTAVDIHLLGRSGGTHVTRLTRNRRPAATGANSALPAGPV